MTNTQNQIPTPTFDLKPGDFVLIDGEPREIFDAYRYTGRGRVVEYIDAERSIRRTEGDEFVRVVGSAIR